VSHRPRSTVFARIGLLPLVCLVVFASPATATAKVRPARAGRGKAPLENVRIALRGANGYRIAVSTHALGNASPRATVSVRRGHAWAEYDTRANVTSTRVVASFGRFGRIDLRFHPSGRVQRHRQKNCDGSIAVLKRHLGVFTGAIRFRGEDGYTEASAARVKGSSGNPWVGVGFDVSPACGPAPRRRGPRTVLLEAQTIPLGRGFSAFAETDHRVSAGRAQALFAAGTAERVGRVSIYRTAAVVGPSSDFVFDDGAFRSATVTPPPPFTGSATFARNPDGSTSWAGTLGVDLPGRESVALAGPEFESTLGVLKSFF
jgi:hypothetical protein